MAVELDDAAQLSPSIQDLARDLGTAISDLDSYDRYLEARAAVRDEPELQTAIERFESLRQEFVDKRAAGEATQSDVRELRRTQRELHDHPIMAEYLEAHERMQSQLEAINAAISEPLELEFGAEVGGCCQD